jgi:hypothetical protein
MEDRDYFEAKELGYGEAKERGEQRAPFRIATAGIQRRLSARRIALTSLSADVCP